MESLFINNKYQDFYNQNGFVKIDEILLPVDKIKELLHFANSSGIRQDKGFDVGKDFYDKEVVEKMMDKINSIVSEELNKHIYNYKIFISSFLVKSANAMNSIMPHQDETFIEDESRHYAVNCWIPLIDTDESNGCIGIIRKSNKVFNYICPVPASVTNTPMQQKTASLIPYLEWMPMKAGEAILFDYKTVHASLPNLSNIPRIAISIWITHKDAKYCTYYLKPNVQNVLLRYAIDRSFYIKYSDGRLCEIYKNNGIIDDFEFIEEVEYKFNDISESEIKQTLVQQFSNNTVYLNYFSQGKNDSGSVYQFLRKYLKKIF